MKFLLCTVISSQATQAGVILILPSPLRLRSTIAFPLRLFGMEGSLPLARMFLGNSTRVFQGSLWLDILTSYQIDLKLNQLISILNLQ